MRKIQLLLWLVFISGSLYSQQSELFFSGTYVNTPFQEFVSSLESTSSIRFFFNPDLIQDLRVNASGEHLKMTEVLQNLLSGTPLKYYIDGYNNVLIYSGRQIITGKLPVFKTGKAKADSVKAEISVITEAEKKYLGGKMPEEIETIISGRDQFPRKEGNCLVKGRITVTETGEPLVGATVFIRETGSGAVSDADGYFRLNLKTGEYHARANCVSMSEKPFLLKVFSDGNISVRMEKTVINLNEVTVISRRKDNVQGMQMGFERISSKNMKEIPVVLGERDLLKVAQLLPGVQAAGEGASGLIVRGGNADENLFYLNKVPVYNTSHLFGFFTSFSPDVVSDFTLYKSNIPASYGGRISSVFDISTRPGNRKKFFGQGGISPVTGHFELEGPVVKDRSSFVVSARSSYSDWILSRMKETDLKNSHAGFYDFTAGMNSEISSKNLLKLFGYTSYDRFTLSSTDDYEYANSGGSLSWKRFFSSSLTSDFSAVFSQYWFNHVDKRNVSEAYTHKYILRHTEFRADFNYLTPNNHQVQFGTSGILYTLDRGNILPYGEESTRIPVMLGKEKGIEGALYISDEFPVSPRLTVQGGLRYSFYGRLGPSRVPEYSPGLPRSMQSIKDTLSFGNNKLIKTYSGPEVRVALNYLLDGDQSLKVSYNRIRQYIFMLSNTMAISPDDQWKLADYYIKPPVCDQVSAGYYRDIPAKGISASFEMYRKWIRNIVEYRDGASFITREKAEMVLLQGRQNVFGMEWMVRKNTGKITGWLSYSYSNSSILVKNNIPDNQINNGKSYPSNYDRPHSLNLMANMRYSRRISVSFNLVYNTGRPITYPVAIYRYEGKYLLCYSGRNQYRLPDYFRTDCSLNLEGNLLYRKLIHSSWMLNVYNLFSRQNAYSVFFEADQGNIKGYKLSVFARPIVTLSWNFKFGNYANE
jgi:hypothetical protein